MELMKGPETVGFPFFSPQTQSKSFLCTLRNEIKYSKPFTGGVTFSSSLQILEVNYSLLKLPMAQNLQGMNSKYRTGIAIVKILNLHSSIS